MIDFRRRADGRVLRIGHRGAAALAPENTLRAFEAALALGVDFVEFDVLELGDGSLVLAHDEGVYEAGAASLADALAFFAQRRDVGLHVDVKSRRGQAVARALAAAGLVERAVASSFWPSTLRDLRAGAPALAVALTYPEDRRGIASRRLARPFVVPAAAVLGTALPLRLPRWLAATGSRVAMLHYAVVSRAAVRRCHDRGVAVWAWTVNDEQLLTRVVELGVDGVISDDPRIFGP